MTFDPEGKRLAGVTYSPERSARALYMPPVRSRFLLSTAPAWEKIGTRFLSNFAGVTMVEATKQIYALSGMERVPQRRGLAFPQALPHSRPVRRRAQ